MQNDVVASLRTYFIGAWRCHSSGVTTDLLLGEDGRYVNINGAGLTQHWGTWTVEPAKAPSGAALTFHIHGAAPQSWHGPEGASAIAWPASEQWAIIEVSDDRVVVHGIVLQRLADTVRNDVHFEEGSLPF